MSDPADTQARIADRWSDWFQNAIDDEVEWPRFSNSADFEEFLKWARTTLLHCKEDRGPVKGYTSARTHWLEHISTFGDESRAELLEVPLLLSVKALFDYRKKSKPSGDLWILNDLAQRLKAEFNRELGEKRLRSEKQYAASFEKYCQPPQFILHVVPHENDSGAARADGSSETPPHEHIADRWPAKVTLESAQLVRWPERSNGLGAMKHQLKHSACRAIALDIIRSADESAWWPTVTLASIYRRAMKARARSVSESAQRQQLDGENAGIGLDLGQIQARKKPDPQLSAVPRHSEEQMYAFLSSSAPEVSDESSTARERRTEIAGFIWFMLRHAAFLGGDGSNAPKGHQRGKILGRSYKTLYPVQLSSMGNDESSIYAKPGEAGPLGRFFLWMCRALGHDLANCADLWAYILANALQLRAFTRQVWAAREEFFPASDLKDTIKLEVDRILDDRPTTNEDR